MTTYIKPVVKGPIDGNIFAIVGACSKTLTKAGMKTEANNLTERVLKSDSYDHALTICEEYVTFKSSVRRKSDRLGE